MLWKLSTRTSRSRLRVRRTIRSPSLLWGQAARASSARSRLRARVWSHFLSSVATMPHGGSRVVRHHNETGEFDPESNIQFGVGGAGTFSDGKLQTGTKSPFHRLLLKTFANAGAQQRILWDAKPHIGSDVLPEVVTRIVEMIEEAGGSVRCRCRLVDLDVSGGRVRAVTLRSEDPETGTVTEERVPCSRVVLACGHSARDVFELLSQRGVPMKRKTFAMGVRIEHLQVNIDRALYGPAAGNPALGAAPYSLAVHLPSGRSAFSSACAPVDTWSRLQASGVWLPTA